MPKIAYLDYHHSDSDNSHDDNDDDNDAGTRDGLEMATGFMSYFESLYACSGICSTSQFFYSLDLSHGIPQNTCLFHLKEEINDSLTYISVTALLATAVLFLLWVVQYCLWK